MWQLLMNRYLSGFALVVAAVCSAYLFGVYRGAESARLDCERREQKRLIDESAAAHDRAMEEAARVMALQAKITEQERNYVSEAARIRKEAAAARETLRQYVETRGFDGRCSLDADGLRIWNSQGSPETPKASNQ